MELKQLKEELDDYFGKNGFIFNKWWEESFGEGELFYKGLKSYFKIYRAPHSETGVLSFYIKNKDNGEYEKFLNQEIFNIRTSEIKFYVSFCLREMQKRHGKD